MIISSEVISGALKKRLFITLKANSIILLLPQGIKLFCVPQTCWFSSDTITDDNILIFASIYIESLPTVKISIPLCSTTRHVSGLERWRAGVVWYKEAIVSQRQPSRKLPQSVSANNNNMLVSYMNVVRGEGKVSRSAGESCLPAEVMSQSVFTSCLFRKSFGCTFELLIFKKKNPTLDHIICIYPKFWFFFF